MTDTTICPCCKSRVVTQDNYEESVDSDSDFLEPCNTCTHRDDDEDEPTCALCSRKPF